MRKVMTSAELKLWNELRAHRLMGLGFRRQFPVAGYIVDFACPEKKLVRRRFPACLPAISPTRGEIELLPWPSARGFIDRSVSANGRGQINRTAIKK